MIDLGYKAYCSVRASFPVNMVLEHETSRTSTIEDQFCGLYQSAMVGVRNCTATGVL